MLSFSPGLVAAAAQELPLRVFERADGLPNEPVRCLQAFYHEVHDAHVAASAPVLANAGTLRDRLLGVMLAKLEVIEPYHRSARSGSAAPPTPRAR